MSVTARKVSMQKMGADSFTKSSKYPESLLGGAPTDYSNHQTGGEGL